MHAAWVWGLVLAIFFLSPSMAGADEVELFRSERQGGEPWLIRAQKLTYDAPGRAYLAEGQVEVRQGTRRLTADWAQVNEATKIAWLRGNVVMVLEEDVFTGQEGSFNLVTRCGEMHGARLFLKRNHFHIDSPLMRKTGENTYYAENSVVTTCDADRPEWSFYVHRLSVEVDGYAAGRHSLLRLAGVPVAYFPFAVLPVKSSRQTGFLMPQYGQHRAGGTMAEVPFFWAINNQSDLTLYQTVMTNRGYMQGGEFRWRGHQDAASTLRGFFISDGYSAAPTPHRYWVSGMVNQPLMEDWNTRLTLDRVSDSAYLKDFNFGYMSLNRYSRDLLQDFGRNLEQEEVSTRVSSLLLSRNFSWANFTAYGRYYERLEAGDPPPSQRLPGISLNSLFLPLGNWPLRLGVDSSYTYFYQDHGLAGHRLDLHPQALCQVQPLPALDLSSQVGFRGTMFRIDDHTPAGPPDNFQGRALFNSKVSLSSSWARDYGREDSSSQFYRHTLRPEVTYRNIPRFDPRKYPNFDPFDLGWQVRADRNMPVRDGDDPIGGVNGITYGISNHLLRRSQNPQGQALVQELLWFRLSQSAFFNSSTMGLDGTPIRHHRFSDFLGELEFYPARRIAFGMDLGVSPYQEGFDRANVRVTIFDQKRNNYLNVGYLFLHDFAKQIYVTTQLNLLNSVQTYVTYSHTFQTNNKLERNYGLVLQRQCWGVVLSYTERPDDRRVGFSFFLPGIGEKLKKTPVHFPEEGRETANR